MANDMAGKNGDEQLRLYQDVATAQISERQNAQGRRLNDFEVEMRTGFAQLGSSLNAFTNETRTSIAALSSAMVDGRKTQWPVIFLAIGVASSLLGYFVTQALQPIKDTQADFKTAIAIMVDKMVTRDEILWRSSRATEDRDRTNQALIDLRQNSVGRSEWMERNLSRDKEIETIRTDAASDFTKVNADIADIRIQFTPRSEREMILHAIDQRFADFQRQIDQRPAPKAYLP